MHRSAEHRYWMKSAAWWRNEAAKEANNIERLYCLYQSLNALSHAWETLPR